MAEGAPEPRRRLSLRGLLRTVHRDAGNLAVGLTLVYAASGLAVNHIADWDPNFKSYQSTHELGGPLEGEDQAVAERVLQTLHIPAKPSDVYRAAPNQLEITLDRRTLHVDTQTGKVLDEGEQPRFFLRLANWLHLNRGKKAWTFVADGYAVLLLLLAFSGMFMLPGRKGLIGRGGIFVLVGAAVPIAYVVLSGGP
ncbi:PepSY-associated TM helix domain-containing protein [Polyangium jinanense]|uniref:PepSY-associated TM helix domain-containing protein n=1 Tax=Polyangium jinanense TaxID=2829994 RepID=A0A9X3X6C5_9BACT|nr:PepSY-associated TM helix domain-containing protein [Polyangium jinanense]MDC3956122.1 PepSY-associated TM helix domain-containing protein [Polyangium jinanense]MDC3983043.1 PepSY-associated TM helix domain-containing protein [Polyangium jinanense]